MTTSRRLVAILAVLGVATLLYPTAARWFTDREHAVEVSGYADQVDQLPDAEGRALLADAHAYNDALPNGPLHVPAGLGLGDGDDLGQAQDYLRQLDVAGTDTMATLSIPEIGVNLPIRHGVGEHTLARGVGHLPGSSLPAGGPGAHHTILTGHSGLVEDVMFDRLGELEVGDTIDVAVVGTTLRYEVDRIQTVTPDDTSSLRIEPGKNLLTLVTCTPIGVNSHRLLVTAHEVPVPAADTGVTVPGGHARPGFPWWAVLLAATVLVALVISRRGRESRARHLRRREDEPARDRTPDVVAVVDPDLAVRREEMVLHGAGAERQL